jgi:hypothetical protein
MSAAENNSRGTTMEEVWGTERLCVVANSARYSTASQLSQGMRRYKPLDSCEFTILSPILPQTNPILA